MVAISLYRGNLHKVPDVPRRWLVPTPKISLKNFKVLIHRRSRALARLQASATTATTSTPALNPNSCTDYDENRDGSFKNEPRPCELKEPKVEEPEGGLEGEVNEVKESDGDADCSVKPISNRSVTVAEDKHVISENELNPAEADFAPLEDKTEVPLVNPSPNAEAKNHEDVFTDNEKRKREVEEKLQILNEKKHNLVQVLKQILNTEEELKRRASMQGMGSRPSVSLQVDVTNDSGSVSRHITPRGGSEGNLGADVEGGEADDISNHNMHSRHLIRMSSTSPSSDSPHRRPFHHAALHPSRASSGVAVSPSRFAPIGQQGNPGNLPMVSVSGTNFIASSPSPAASGGTSAFRDGWVPSPWN